MQYFQSQWTQALADLKDAAHDAGISPTWTDGWAIRHRMGTSSEIGFYDDAGEFHVRAYVTSPHNVRDTIPGLLRLLED